MAAMPERAFAWWRRFDEVCPLDPTADILRSLADVAVSIFQVKGIDVSRRTFLPWWLQEPDPDG